MSEKTQPTDLMIPADTAGLRELFKRARSGDATTLPALREVLSLDPEAADVLGGDLARTAQESLILKLAGQDLVVREAVTRKVEVLKAELAGTSPAPLERLLIDRIGACWLHLHYLETMAAQRASMEPELDAQYQRSISRAHKRYLAAIRTLALVRKLALPVLQVNIAKKQVNVAGG